MADGRTVSYHEFVLPSWCRWIDSREDVLQRCLALGMTEALAARSVSYMFDSPEQNQLLFSDYLDLVTASDFEVLFFKGYDAPDLALKYGRATGRSVSSGSIFEQQRVSSRFSE